MKIMVILIGVDALGIVPKDLERRLEELDIRGTMKTIQTTAPSRLARRLEEICGFSDSGEKPSVYTKNSQRVK